MAVSEVAIRVENVSKCYTLGEDRPGKGELSRRVGDALRKPLRALGASERRRPRHAGSERLDALQDVSFEVRRGEAVGIIGRNGAGKSTLLKMMSRMTQPTEGRITVHGRVATLLEVGTGFHPELTGRDNMYLNGAILGMRRQEIDEQFEEIVEFSGVERFLDTPVKRYSSGMYVRLAFAIAANLDPEILLVDEVLAVGDQQFQQKCLGKMQDVTGRGRSVVLVSHNLNAIQRHCDRVLFIDGGRLAGEGEPAEVIAQYLDRVEPNQAGGTAATREDQDSRPGHGEARLQRISMTDGSGKVVNSVHLGQLFKLNLEFDVREELETAIEVGIATVDGRRVATAYSVDRGGLPIQLSPGSAEITVEFDALSLVPGEYVFSVYLRRMNNPPIDYVERALRFVALNMDQGGSDHYRWPVQPSVRPSTNWSVGRVGSGLASADALARPPA